MTKKERMDSLLARVSEENKEAFVTEFRKAATKKVRMEVLKKYSIRLTEEEEAALKTDSKEIDARELDLVSGGCTCACGCGFDG